VSAGAARLSPASLYAYERGSVLVPLPFLDLPSELRLLGHAWQRKRELHVTAAHTPSIAERIRGPLGLDAGTAAEAAWAALRDATHSHAVGEIVVSDEYRHARREADRTLIVLCEVDGLDRLYRHLGERLGAGIEPPPAHVTLYTRPGGEAIGLHTREQLQRDTSALSPADAAELRRAMWAHRRQ
jgi:hypothetical protein